MKKGSSISGKPWRAYMDEMMKEYDSENFNSYELPGNFDSLPAMIQGEWQGGESVVVYTVSGKRATEFTPEETRREIQIIDPHTILYWVNKNDPSLATNSQNDAQFENWEYGVQNYVQGYLPHLLAQDFEIPDEFDDVHTEDNQG